MAGGYTTPCHPGHLLALTALCPSLVSGERRTGAAQKGNSYTLKLTPSGYITPNSVTFYNRGVSQPLCFLQHFPWRLCYDGAAHGQTGRARGREETVWTSSRW